VGHGCFDGGDEFWTEEVGELFDDLDELGADEFAPVGVVSALFGGLVF